MKKIFITTLVTGALAISLTYILHKVHKTRSTNVLLDFAELALGGF